MLSAPTRRPRFWLWPAAASLVSLALILSASLHVAAASAADGPYVTQQPDGAWLARWVEGDVAAPRVREQRAAVGRPVVVPAVGSLPEFTVWLRAPALLAPDAVKLPTGTPLFVVADTHGEFEILAEMLQHHRIVDRRLKWSFGSGHLVFLGDVFDRGPNQTEILWWIYQLDAEAQKANGGVHLVLGNHETMVMRGDLRYLNPKYPKTAQVLGVGSYAELFNAESILGQWLRTKQVVLRINDLLCLHGGISRAMVDLNLTLADINTTVRAVLNRNVPDTEADRKRADFMMKNLGPLWYRGYFTEQKDFPTATIDDIDRAREHFGVRTILVGHSTVPTITPLYDGKVIAVQVYPQREEETGRAIFESLLVKDGAFFRAQHDGSIERLN